MARKSPDRRGAARSFVVGGSFELPDLAGADVVDAVDEAEEHRLLLVDHDTADLRLTRDGVSLRRRARSGGTGEDDVDDAGWHLVVPRRGRWAGVQVDLPAEGDPLAPAPAELLDLLTATTRRAEVEPVLVLRVDRALHVLRDAAGAALASVALDEVAAVDPSAAAGAEDAVVLRRWRELHLGPPPGEAHLPRLRGVVARLRAAGARRPEGTAAERVLGRLASAPADVPRPGRVRASDPAGRLVRAHLATQVRALVAADVAVRRGEDDAVHQVRVAARRLRSGLRAFRPLLDRGWADDLRAELGWLAGELGRARDAEVLAARLEDDLAALPGPVAGAAREVVGPRVEQQAADGAEAALAALRGPRYALLLDQLVSAVALPALTPRAQRACADVLPPLVGAAWRRLEEDVRRLDAEDPRGDEAWHEARKRAKQVRYAAEAVRPALGSPAKRLGKQVARVTEVLGQHQDAAVAAEGLEEALRADPPPTPDAAFALGALWARQRQAVLQTRGDLLDLWPDVADRRHRRWTRG
ncbi:CHAD domain-containing protein [Pseudokineococcus lusitanus]|uniref:CHAD domain-containing protein n=1 Tax=Pseudokineococcus lusitanus TaxID=763993 RepID=A0A3N1GAH5_9ACTN|nr:CHAD domain-containing protein [Pseudokineococcus lusitanus]ROP27235.1 CHAD domain-containing protein [Pseudokineococcus lusitanus]